MIRLSDPVRALLAGLSIFLIGAIVGLSVDRLILIPVHAHAVETAATSTMRRNHEAVLAELAAEVGLTTEQSASVRAIFASHQGDINRAWADVHANLRSTIAAATTDVEAVLDDDQILRLHDWLERSHGAIPGHPAGLVH